MSGTPLVVDLDGTLIKTDSLHEVLITGLLRQPWRIFTLLGALAGGRGAFKAAASQMWALNPAAFCYRSSILDLVKDARSRACAVHLVTAADQSIADGVQAHLGCFDSATGSDGLTNLKGDQKLAHLRERFPAGFDYAGDSRADLPVWRAAKSAILVGPGRKYHGVLRREGVEVKLVQDEDGGSLKDWLKGLRLHQWVKNLIIFLPLALGHVFADLEVLARTAAAFLLFGVIASATYIINDLADLEADRLHRSKRNRALASGRIPAIQAAIVAAAMIAFGFAGAWLLSPPFFGVALGYFVLTLAYSFRLKRIPLYDVAVIGMLFTLRMVMGIVLGPLPFSPWAIAFSMLLFFSLALAKRHSEIMNSREAGTTWVPGRGYRTDDWPLTLGAGLASALSAVVVLLLFVVNGIGEYSHYSRPAWLYLTPLVIWLWVLRIWLLSHRMVLHDDPIIFALKDKVSYALGGVALAAFVLAI